MKRILAFNMVLIGFFVSGLQTTNAVECKTATQKNCTVTLRDGRGIKVGTEERGSNGVTTVRDSRGIKQGTITSNSSKPTCEVIRDSRGIKVGTRGQC